MDWIVIQTLNTELEAMIAKGALEAAGLDCRLQLHPRGDTMLGAFGAATGPTDLLVEKQDAKRASSLLEGNKE